MAQSNLFSYYEREIAKLRHLSKEFSAEHPVVSSNMGLNESPGEDPHVRRLLESFAFLTAGLQKRLDDHFPEMVDLLVNAYYPDFLAVIPSMGTIQFNPAAKSGHAQSIPKGTMLSIGQEGIKFQTCYDTEVCPVSIEGIQYREAPYKDVTLPDGARSVLTVDLSTEKFSSDFSRLKDQKDLRFFIACDFDQALEWLYRFHKNLVSVYLEWDDQVVNIGRDSYRSVGLAPHESIAPFERSHVPAFKLIWEYFQFPQKFLYFDIQGIFQQVKDGTSKIRVHFAFDKALKGVGPYVDSHTLKLGCTPIINLFSERIEPFKTDGRFKDIPLHVSERDQDKLEVYRVEEIYADFGARERRVFDPFFNPRSLINKQGIDGYWIARRVAPVSYRRIGSETLISFVDQELNPCSYEKMGYLRGKVLATNRGKTMNMSGLLQKESFQLFGLKGAAIGGLQVVGTITNPVWPGPGRSNLWRLLSVIQVQDLLTSTGQNQLQNLCAAYNFGDQESHRGLWQHLIAMNMKPGSSPMFIEGQAVMVSGINAELQVEDHGEHGRMFLLAQVLDQVIARMAPTNTFSKFTVRRRSGGDLWLTFPPRRSGGDLL